jgi:hypothetical protein
MKWQQPLENNVKKTAKKKIKMDGRSEMMQVFDGTHIPSEFLDIDTRLIIARDWDEIRNDSYYRWYPDRVEQKKIGIYEHFRTKEDWEAGKLLNDWLLEHGMKIKDEFCFHVLIHISW